MDSSMKAGSPAGHAARRRTLAEQFRAVATATVASAALSACGGGGGGDAPEPPPPPAPTPAPSPSPAPTGPIAAQMTVPTPVGYDADRLAAFNRLNEIRLSAGLGMLAQSTAMDQAGHAHALWMVANDSFTHDEVAGTSGFTGESWAVRDEAFGYVPVEGSEVIAGGGQVGAEVDALISGVYHRAGLLAFEPVDVGIGWTSSSATHVSSPLVVDLTKPGTDAIRGMGQSAQSSIHGVAVWPLDHAIGVPCALGLESPDPIPGRDVLTLGIPVSITVGKSRTISVVTFTLTDGSTGLPVPVHVLTNQNDPNFLIPGSFISIIPLDVLSSGTTYRATFAGSTVEFGSGKVEAISRDWSFTTSP